ncbi:MAG: sulfatase [Verrucomicrobiales bacterium]|nr:sulfatase [Verrucomicrobiales bacterium]
MQFRFRLLLLALCFSLPSFGQDDEKVEKKPAPPNIVLIIADDLNWDDSTPYGHKTISTPNLQRMADEGMRFDNAFVTISSCSPSRASIITGRYPTNTGADELHWPVPAEQVTFVEKLKEAGYWTGAAGKWHLGDAMRDRFDEVMEVDTSGFQLPSGEEGKKGKFKETLEGEAQSGCADWIPLIEKRDEDKPFFLWLAALDPHRPYHEGILPEATDPDTVAVAPYHADTPETRKDYALYYDEIIRLDKYVGMVLDKLEEEGVGDNTMVLFFSDNGRPFPRDKTTMYDSGIKTPWLVRWPDRVKAGTVSKRLVSAVDIAPTALEIAGIDEREKTFEGRSFLKTLDDPEHAIREFVFAEKNWHDYEDHVRAVRNERYKYIRNAYNDLPQTPSADSARSPTFESLKKWRDEGKLLPHQMGCFIQPRPKEELYDTVADPYELNNLAADERYEPVLNAMREALGEWEKRTGDFPPDLRTADEFDRVTGVPTAARVRPRWSKERMVKAGLAAE